MKFKAIIAATVLMLAASAEAKLFTVTWSGDRFGNAATATGRFDINTAVYPNLVGPEFIRPVGPDFRILGLTITGASSGNGSFTESDFAGFVFEANTALNYNAELIGQLMGNGFRFGDFGAGYGGPSGDFNLFAGTPGSPNGTFYFQLTTNGGGGDSLAVTSISAAVPEPASWALMIAGFGLVGVAARRRTGALAA